MGYKPEDKNTNWMMFPIQKMEGPWQHEICTCCELEGLQGWSTLNGGFFFSHILDIISWDHLRYFKNERHLAPEEFREMKTQGNKVP